MADYPRFFNRNKVKDSDDLKGLLQNAVELHGDLNLFTWKKDPGTESITYGEFADVVNCIGTALESVGLMGCRVALLAETRFEWVASYFAVVNGNGVIIPLDKELTVERLHDFITLSKAEAIVFSESFRDVAERYALENPGKLKCLLNMDSTENAAENLSADVFSWDSFVARGKAELAAGNTRFAEHKVDNKIMCSCLFTSGTTGTSKAVMLSHLNLTCNALASARCVGLWRGDRVVSVLPAHHTYETTCTYFADIALGVEICVNDSLKQTMRNFLLFKPNKLVLVPLFVDNIVKKIKSEIEKKGKTKTVKAAVRASNALRKVGVDLRRKLFKDILDAFGGNLHLIVCGGAPLNPDHISYLDGFGISVVQGYGITECSPLVAVNANDMLIKKIGSVGHPVFDVDVKIDAESGKEGEILVRGDNVMLGYMDNEEATREVMTEDGYFRTGDIGYLDRDNHLYITGRKKNVIISNNGKNIYPEELEEYISRIENVLEVAVIGRYKNAEDIHEGVQLTALIFPEYDKFKNPDGSEMSRDDVTAVIKKAVNEVNRTLPAYKHIEVVELRDTEFERTTSKKIMRYKLK